MKRNWTPRGISNQEFHLTALQRNIVKTGYTNWIIEQKGKMARQIFGLVERFEEAATERGSISRRNKIRGKIVEKSVSVPDRLPDSFFDKIQDEIGRYKAVRDIAKESTPTMVRRNLQNLEKVADQLCRNLEGLDFNSRELLRAAKGSKRSATFGDLFERALFVKNAVRQAQISAAQYPMGARRHTEPERVQLACGIAAAIADHLQIDPTSSADGLFVALLSAVMEIATGSGKDVRDLAVLALKSKWREFASC